MFIEEETMFEVGAKASGKNSRNYKKLNPIAQSSNSSMVISDPSPGHVPGAMIFDKNPCPSRGAMIDHEMKSGNLKIKSGKQLNHENEHDMIASLAIIDPKIKSVRQTKSKKEYDIISIPRPDSVIGSGLKFGKQSSYQKDFDTDSCSSPGIVIDPAVKMGMLDSVIDNNMKSGKQSNNQKEFDMYTCPSHSVDVDPETELVSSDTEVNYGGQSTNHKVFDMISCPSPDFVIDPEVKVGRPDIMIDTRGKWGRKSKKEEESDVYQCESPGIVIDPEAMSGSHSDNKKGFGKITCPSSDTLVNSEAKFGKKSNETKEFDMITINVSNPTRNPGISLNSSCQPSPCPSPGVVYNSDWTSNLSTANASTKTSDAKTSDSCASQNRGSFSSTRSNSLESSTSAPIKRHTGGDSRWEAIQLANSRNAPLGLSHFRLLKRLGYGDIGSVYLVELKGTNAYFAMKVMDKASIANRNKLVRAQTEREILGLLDHPFLPNLYSHFETDKFYCLVMEYCSGGNLHSLRQKQPNKYFTEQAAKFYASEILLALEYLHMLGIIYRDLKPENVLVREEGHIMLSDFDLSLRCSVNPTLVKSSSAHVGSNGAMFESDHALQGCIQPSTFFPRILPKKNRKSKSDFSSSNRALPELMAEPTNARSMSFVGTHEYLAPEIIKGEGHGSAVDWWTFGIFLYELMHGTTPFKGSGNRATLLNVVGQPLKFPDSPVVSLVARDLIRGLLVKDPQRRIAYRRGATEIKQHPFFEGVNWALVRSAMPPHIPDPVDYSQFVSKETNAEKKKNGCGSNLNTSGCQKNEDKNKGSETYIDFEYF